MKFVLDASALIAVLTGEPGAERVEAALTERCLMSAVNWAEVLARRPQAGGVDDETSLRALTSGDEPSLTIVPFDEHQARDTARIRLITTGVQLSLADRACLALGRLHNVPVLTTDRAWRRLGLKVKIVVVR